MTLVISQTATTYGDATRTVGEDFLDRRYVLAQFHSATNFDWVREVRRYLVRDELKYLDYRQAEPRLRANGLLWKRIQSGLNEATIIVIDGDELRHAITGKLLHEGAELRDIEENSKSFVEMCGVALIGSTPIAYLPHRLVSVSSWSLLPISTNFTRFYPEKIVAELGGKLRDIQVFTARAHAIFDVASCDDKIATTGSLYSSPLASVMLAEVLSTGRVFDTEAPKTLAMLNEATDEIARSLGAALGTSNQTSPPLIREAESSGIDEIQAADIAAGKARELLELGDNRTVAGLFRRVWVNGRRINP